MSLRNREDSMRTWTTQTSLDLRGEGLRALWKRFPERSRTEAIAIWTWLIARAAQGAAHKKGVPR